MTTALASGMASQPQARFPALRYLPFILDFWQPGATPEPAAAAPPTTPADSGVIPAFPLAWMAAAPSLRSHLEWRAAHDTRKRPRARAVVAGIEYRREREDIAHLETSETLLSDVSQTKKEEVVATEDTRFALEPCDWAPSRAPAPTLSLDVAVRGDEDKDDDDNGVHANDPSDSPGKGLAVCGLAQALWWLKRCAGRDRRFAVALTLRLQRQRQGQRRKREGKEAPVSAPELSWLGATAEPGRAALADLAMVLRLLHVDNLSFTEAALRSLPRLFPGVAAACFTKCNVAFQKPSEKAGADLPAEDAGETGPYGWEGLCVFSCDHMGSEMFWRHAAGDLLTPPTPTPARLAPLRVVSLTQCSANSRQLEVLMGAVADRQHAAAALGASLALEVELSFMKGQPFKGPPLWLTRCAGPRGDGLRALVLPRTPSTPSEVADALVACTAVFAAAHASSGSGGSGSSDRKETSPFPKLHLLDIRWNIDMTDAFLQQLIGAGVHAHTVRVAGTDTSSTVGRQFADNVSP